MQGWVFVYLPGDLVYQVVDFSQNENSLKTQIVRKGLKLVHGRPALVVDQSLKTSRILGTKR